VFTNASQTQVAGCASMYLSSSARVLLQLTASGDLYATPVGDERGMRVDERHWRPTRDGVARCERARLRRDVLHAPVKARTRIAPPDKTWMVGLSAHASVRA
jgi:hypothetical protein